MASIKGAWWDANWTFPTRNVEDEQSKEDDYDDAIIDAKNELLRQFRDMGCPEAIIEYFDEQMDVDHDSCASACIGDDGNIITTPRLADAEPYTFFRYLGSDVFIECKRLGYTQGVKWAIRQNEGWETVAKWKHLPENIQKRLQRARLEDARNGYDIMAYNGVSKL